MRKECWGTLRAWGKGAIQVKRISMCLLTILRVRETFYPKEGQKHQDWKEGHSMGSTQPHPAVTCRTDQAMGGKAERVLSKEDPRPLYLPPRAVLRTNR